MGSVRCSIMTNVFLLFFFFFFFFAQPNVGHQIATIESNGLTLYDIMIVSSIIA